MTWPNFSPKITWCSSVKYH